MKRTTSILLCLGLTAFTATASAQQLTWTGCQTTKTAFMSSIASAYEQTMALEITLSSEGSTAGIRQTASGAVDIGGTSRRVAEDKIEQRVRLHPVAWDAIVAVVHPDNPLDGITLEELQQVMSGDITNWQQLGGVNHPIQVYTRKGNRSGIGQTARELLFGSASATLHSTKTFTSSADVQNAVAKAKYSIALETLSSAKNHDLKQLQLDDVEAVSTTVASGAYPLAHPLYLVTSRQPIPAVKSFVMWTQSPAGQAVIEAQGTVSLHQGNRLWMAYNSRIAQLSANTRQN